jgi:hypothetical protein
MRLWILIFAIAGLFAAACDSGVPQRQSGSEGKAAQSAAGASSDEGKAARSAAGR